MGYNRNTTEGKVHQSSHLGILGMEAIGSQLTLKREEDSLVLVSYWILDCVGEKGIADATDNLVLRIGM